MEIRDGEVTDQPRPSSIDTHRRRNLRRSHCRIRFRRHREAHHPRQRDVSLRHCGAGTPGDPCNTRLLSRLREGGDGRLDGDGFSRADGLQFTASAIAVDGVRHHAFVFGDAVVEAADCVRARGAV